MAKAESLKIFHCADLHVGLKFAKYPPAISERLRDARLATLEKMVERSNREACDLFVVAGDLFDTLKVSARDVNRAAKILARASESVLTGDALCTWRNPRLTSIRMLSVPLWNPSQSFPT